ncbi:MAG: hypothetical protein ACK5RJ_11485 [Burkholderiales bacterium]|jgi:hypothetical protein|nr:hypothetical protein [Rhodocyclaceae bacterium]MCA3023049.1 hypothetical protein [Rhodocyclaceae bacterium]MCA3054493.1 hypothetical protein [Rhodocyclaceae bacterium]MCA3055024.1 hypothetical protein [Rhodocyclaceae bacterium]
MHDYIIVIQSLALGYVGVAVVPPSIRKHGFRRNMTLWGTFFTFATFWLVVNYGRFDLTEALVRAAMFGCIPIGAGSLVFWLVRKNS